MYSFDQVYEKLHDRWLTNLKTLEQQLITSLLVYDTLSINTTYKCFSKPMTSRVKQNLLTISKHISPLQFCEFFVALNLFLLKVLPAVSLIVLFWLVYVFLRLISPQLLQLFFSELGIFDISLFVITMIIIIRIRTVLLKYNLNFRYHFYYFQGNGDSFVFWTH